MAKAKVSVPRAELAKLVGVAPDVDDATLQKAVEQTVARETARKAAAERAARDEQFRPHDERVVAAAIAQGKIHPTGKQRWLTALKADREGMQKVIASLALGIRPVGGTGYGPGPEMEAVFDHVMARLGIPTKKSSQNTEAVQAAAPLFPTAATQFSADESSIPPAYRDLPRRTVTNSNGERLFDTFQVAGKPYEQWSQQEKDDALLWQLGPRFRAGLKPPPEQVWYTPPVPGSAADVDNAWRGTSDFQQWGQ